LQQYVGEFSISRVYEEAAHPPDLTIERINAIAAP
jgi:hypothetical protein